MVEPLRHRQTKEAATDMFSLQPPRHIPTLPAPSGRAAWWTRGRASYAPQVVSETLPRHMVAGQVALPTQRRRFASLSTSIDKACRYAANIRREDNAQSRYG